MQEVRDAVTTFRYGPAHANSSVAIGAGSTSADASSAVDDGKRKKFTIAVADTFGEGGPVRYTVH